MGLLELALKMIACLVIAGLLGWIIGFLLGRIFGSANAAELLNECEGKMRMREQEMGGLRADLTAANSKVSSLQTELATLATTLKTRDGWVTEMEGKNRELQADLDALIIELDELNAVSGQATSALTAQWETKYTALGREKEQEIARLKVRITELEMMARDVKEPAVKVSSASALPPSPKEVDDLKRVYGIGPALEKLLNEQGVYWFRQIANWTQEDINHYDELLAEFHGRIEREGWINSAREEHFKKYNEQL